MPIAVIDDCRRLARIVAGGTAEPFDIVVEEIGTSGSAARCTSR